MPSVVSLEPVPVDVEGFPDGCARSVKGSLRLPPGKPVAVTDDEARALCAKGVRFRQLPEHPVSIPPPAPEPQADASRADESREEPKDGAGGGATLRRRPRRLHTTP